MKVLALATALAAGLITAPTSAVSDECGLYLAVSSTSTAEKTSWGIYAGVDIPANTQLGHPDVGVVTHNLRANSKFTSEESTEEETAREEALLKNVEFLEELIWVAASAGAKFEAPAGQAATAALPGTGSLAAFSPKGTNAGWMYQATYNRPAWGEEPGVTHPGRGASSQFYHATVQSTTSIEAGSEIFMDYGDNWEDETQKDELTATDYERLDATVDQMIDFFAKHGDSLKPDAKLQVYQFITKDVLNAAVGAGKAKRVLAVLPSRPEDLIKVKQAGGVVKYSQPTMHRSTEWLQQHGTSLMMMSK
jgi:hypothetical protein